MKLFRVYANDTLGTAILSTAPFYYTLQVIEVIDSIAITKRVNIKKPFVKKLIGKVSRICEFGSGPGFIGFSLLSNGLCDSLCLIDINPEAVKLCKKTIQENKLESKVSIYLSDGLSNIPSSEKWDLVVSNWFGFA